MPKKAIAYAGFTDLTDYLSQRLARDGMSRAAASLAVGKDKNYISCITRTDERPPTYSPSLAMCDRIAALFGDEPHIVRVLAGREAPPPDAEARGIADRIARLTPEKRKQVVEFIDFLNWKRA